MSTPRETVATFYELLAKGPEGAAELPALLAEDMTFEGPILKAANRDEFIAGMRQFDFSAGEVQMRHMFEDGDHVCVVYDFKLPKGTVPNVQLFNVQDGRITSQQLVFNLPEFQAAAG